MIGEVSGSVMRVESACGTKDALAEGKTASNCSSGLNGVPNLPVRSEKWSRFRHAS